MSELNIKTAFATGIPATDIMLKNTVDPEAEIVGYKEYLLENNYDRVFLSRELPGTLDMDDLLLELVSKGAEIIYLTATKTKEDRETIAICLALGIQNILTDPLMIKNEDGEIVQNKIQDFLTGKMNLKSKEFKEFYIKYSHLSLKNARAKLEEEKRLQKENVLKKIIRKYNKSS